MIQVLPIPGKNDHYIYFSYRRVAPTGLVRALMNSGNAFSEELILTQLSRRS